MHAQRGARRAVLRAVLAVSLITGVISLGRGDSSVAGAGTNPASLEAGVVTDLTWGIPASDYDRTVSAVTGVGGRWVRMNLNWGAGEEHGRGMLNAGYLSTVDAAVNKARAAGLQVLMPIADGVPYWASADPAKYTDGNGAHWNKAWKPAAMADYASFVERMVARYAALGVHAYEVWNEPNLARFWPSGVNAADYTQMLTAAYPAIKRADPSALVVMGGLSKNDYPFLQALYAAGAAPYFDVAAVHPYTATDPTMCWNQAGTTERAIDAFCGIEAVRNVMVANGDSATTLWLTEFGWSTSSAPYSVTEAAQADFVTKALDRTRSLYPYVRVALWYSLRNNYWSADQPDDFEANFGLLRTDFSTKPAYAAFKAWTGGATPVPTTTTAPATTTTTAPTTTTTTTAPPASTAPLSISNVQVATDRYSATITWTTTQPGTSVVTYGTWSLSATASGANDVTSHSVTLRNLSRRTSYIFRVRTTDATGATVESATSGFTTKK